MKMGYLAHIHHITSHSPFGFHLPSSIVISLPLSSLIPVNLIHDVITLKQPRHELFLMRCITVSGDSEIQSFRVYSLVRFKDLECFKVSCVLRPHLETRVKSFHVRLLL